MVHNIVAIPMELSQQIQRIPRKERKLKKIFFHPSLRILPSLLHDIVSQLREISQQDCTQRDSIAGNTMQRYNNPSEKGRELREILETSFSAFREGRRRKRNISPRETIIFVSFKIHSSNWPPSTHPAQ